MIYTLTFSPAIDYVIELDDLKVGQINRTKSEVMMAGGKGINVSVVLANLGRTSVASGFIAGFTGEFIKDELEKKGIKTDFVEVEGKTRINVKIRGNEETAINGQGPAISDEKIDELVDKLSKLTSDDLLIISGTIPKTLPSNIYEIILDRIKDNHVGLVVDCEKDILLSTLKNKPLLVKPNKEELEEMFNTKIDDYDSLVVNAKKLMAMGARNVIISLGGSGALLLSEDGLEVKLAPPGKGRKVVNTVGAGDSLVAGFVDEYLATNDIFKAFKKGIATGSASAFSIGLATKEEVLELLNEMEMGNR